MRYIPLALLVLLLIPAETSAARSQASFLAGRSLIVASSSPGSSYLAGASVVHTAPVAGDLLILGGTVVTTGSVQGDELLLAGSVNSRAPVAGSVRAIGAKVGVEGAIGGDLIGFGFSFSSAGRASGSTFVIAADVELSNGAGGPVVIYGNNVSLSGDFANDVRVVVTGHLSLKPDTTIRGSLSYEAPETASIPDSATVRGGIEYANASYLPDVGTSRILALASIGVFLLARTLGALILAGLLAGLFPLLAEEIGRRAFEARPRSILFTVMLGFGTIVAVPVLILLLALTFVGLGLALLLLVVYALLVLLAFLYAGILLGNVLANRFLKRGTVRWHDGVLGMLVLSLVSLVPYLGYLVVCLLTVFSAGALLQIFFQFAFPHEEHTQKLL